MCLSRYLAVLHYYCSCYAYRRSRMCVGPITHRRSLQFYLDLILLWFADLFHTGYCCLFHAGYFSLCLCENAPKICRVSYKFLTHYLDVWSAKATSWNLWRNIETLSATTDLCSHSRIEVSTNSDRGRNPNFLCSSLMPISSPGTETKNLPV